MLSDGSTPTAETRMRLAIALACLLLAAAPAAAKERVYKPIRAGGAQPPITNPSVIPAKSVKDQVTAGELVLGVSVGGVSRAYPINMIAGPKRGVINDRLAGIAVAATW